MEIAKLANGRTRHIPLAMAEARALKAGNEDEILVAGSRDAVVARELDRDELMNHLRALRGRLPFDFKFERDEANAR